jgi:hypothetical protein
MLPDGGYRLRETRTFPPIASTVAFDPKLPSIRNNDPPTPTAGRPPSRTVPALTARGLEIHHPWHSYDAVDHRTGHFIFRPTNRYASFSLFRVVFLKWIGALE